ncbi:M56 family metallopeptidase [Chryseobacterium caseinilyticum]|uniref:Peptidase M56 domain-containing protein n=1 Tax=Chryseobacterium caseinilyticum TaxID=2771428 RepID=A0ABR8ZA04_9FLAO|nr:M56 family metallopeptidase [Chryseobacterium caseinilyticum]MBD8081929.1 hypothetical protein [Chryseobacterium caseinilyticum]
MENLFIYILKLFTCSGVMFLYYQLSLKDKTFHHYNRFYLLATMLVSIFLPLLKVEDFTIEVSDRIYLLFEQVQSFKNPKNINNDHIYFRIIFSALGLVSLIFVAKILTGIYKIEKLKNSFRKEQIKGINFYQTNLTDAPFSYFRNLFWKDSITLDSDVGRQILKHEMVHIEQKHSIDKIFAEVITAVFWFNPFFYLIKKEISLIHEYLADNKAVEKKDTKAFAQMLLTSHFSGTALPAASPFLNSNLKKRLQMLQKPNTKFGYTRRILALPIVFTVAFAYLVNAKNTEIKKTNIEIEKAVAEIKKDTISPKNETERLVKLQEEKIFKASEKLKLQSGKLKTLSEKSKEKAAELQKIAKEKGEKSYDFELKAKELKQLSGEMDRIANQIIIGKDGAPFTKDIEFQSVMPDGNSVFYKLNNIRKVENIDFEKLFDSNEVRERLGFSEEKFRKLKESLNNPQIRGNLEKANKLYINGIDVLDGSKGDVIKFPEGAILKINKTDNGSTDVSWSPGKDVFFDKKESPENAKRRAKLEKEAAKLNAKRAKLEGERAKIEAERRMLAGKNPMVIRSVKSISAPFPPVNGRITAMRVPNVGVNISKGNSLILSDNENVTYFINGKEVTEADFKKLDSNKIKSVTVKKNNTDGKSSGEVRIETK